MNEDVTVLVSSCDKYEDAWEPFFRLFHIMGADKATSNPVVLNTETKCYSCDYMQVKTINTPGKATWSERLLHVLGEINTDFVFHVLEDFFIQQPFNLHYFEKVMDEMRSHPEEGAMHITPNGRFPADAQEMFLERKFEKLNITVTCVIWRRTFLIDLLRKHENIWQFEWYSTFRAKKFFPNVKIMQYNERFPIIFDYRVNISEGYGITESKWLPKNKELFDKYNIKVDYERLGWYVPHEKVKEAITLRNYFRRGMKHIRTRISVWKSLH